MNVGDAFTFDSFRGEAAEFSFDFGFMYAVNDNFRIGVHFQQPYIDFTGNSLNFKKLVQHNWKKFPRRIIGL